MASTSQLLSFPSELLIMVLQNIGCKDLTVCSMVCKRLHKLIKEAPELSYTIELGVDGLVDGPRSDLSRSERLRILLDLRSRWRTLDWVKRETVNLHPMKPKHNNMHYAQGIFSQAMRLSGKEDQYESSIFCTTLPTRTMEAADCGPLDEDDGLWYRAFCMDPAADVIIFVEMAHEDLDDVDSEEPETESESTKSCLTFYPRSLSSKGTRLHPSCQTETSGFISGSYDAAIMEPQIAGDMVGVTVTDDLSDSIVIYNWHSGDLVVKMSPLGENPTWSIRDFTFLTPRSFVLSAALWNGRTYTERALLLFTFCDESSDGAPFAVTAGAVKHIVTLLLPEVAAGQYPSGYINTTPCASYQPRGMPFVVQDSSRILVYDAGDYNSHPSVRMVVHTDVFIKARELLSKGSDVISKTRQIPWDAWGPDYTRLFMARAHDYIDLPQRPIHGERMVMQMTEAGEPTSYLMDFNRREHRRQMASGNDTALITEPSILPPSLFTKPITSSLPYTAVRIPDTHLYDGFLLDEQRLLGLKGSNPVEELDVFAF